MGHFLCRLMPPRPTFAQDMDEAERAAMQAHVVYWTGLAEAGKVIVFGPVADPAGSWGMGVLDVADRDEAEALVAADPAVAAGIGMRAELLPMPVAVTRR